MSSRPKIAGLCVVALIAQALAAPLPALGEDFTFRRVKPPAAGATKRITIQVEKTWPYETDDRPFTRPREAAAAAAAPAPLPQDLPGQWFWERVSPDLGAADASRLGHVLEVLNASPAEKARFEPDPATIETILREYGPSILMATAGKRVSPALVLSVIVVESAGRPNAVSPKGAQGLMQLIPATADRFGVTDPSDPVQNIRGGAAYLDWLLGEFRGDPVLSLAGYNAGENAVRSNGGVPPFAETRAYVPKVLAAWDRARMYCQTLPRRVDDGCVFAFERSLSQ